MTPPGKIHGDQQCAKVEEGMREQAGPTMDGLLAWTNSDSRELPIEEAHEAIQVHMQMTEQITAQSTRIRELEAKVERYDQAIAAITFPDISASNAEAMAFHSKRGESWAGIPRKAFEEWLFNMASQLREFSKRLTTTQKGQ